MLPLEKINKKYAIICVLLLGVSILAYAVNDVFFKAGDKPFMQKESEAVTQDTKIKITPNTELVQKIQYVKCNDEEILQTKPTDNIIGLNVYQLQNIYQGWVIEKFDAAEILMSLKVDSYCKEHANNMFIGIQDRYVAVFYGKPGNKPILKEVTKIEINKLMPQDIEELKHGIIVESKEELLRTLEGMQSR